MYVCVCVGERAREREEERKSRCQFEMLINIFAQKRRRAKSMTCRAVRCVGEGESGRLNGHL